MFFLKKNYGFCCWEINMCYLCFLHVIWNIIIVRVFFVIYGLFINFCYVCDDLMEEKMLCLLLAIIMLGINKIYIIWV